MKTKTIRRPDDFHLHLRMGSIMQSVLPPTACVFKRALIMPNTDPAVLTALDVGKYRGDIKRFAPGFQPLMTIKILPSTTEACIIAAKEAGAIAGKVYPEGVTTNSKDGARSFRELYAAFEVMEQVGMVLCVHGELPGVFCLDRERAFIERVLMDELVIKFPKLRIVFEHITTCEAVEAVKELPERVAATITAHHLYLTLDDVIGGSLRPHNFCKPIAKRVEDRTALRQVAMSGNPKFFFGSDSAPHPRDRKECSEGCAGVFTAPVAMPLLAELFDELDALDRLEAFTSEFGAKFYQLPLNEGTVTLEERPWKVPGDRAGIVPFMAGQELKWSVAR